MPTRPPSSAADGSSMPKRRLPLETTSPTLSVTLVSAIGPPSIAYESATPPGEAVSGARWRRQRGRFVASFAPGPSEGESMASDLQISEERRGPGVAVVTPRGQIDLFSAPEFKTRLLGAIDGGTTMLVVDLGETLFMDSSALASLVAGRTRVAGRGGRPILCGLSDDLRSRFELTGLDKLFSIVGTRDEALAMARAAPA